MIDAEAIGPLIDELVADGDPAHQRLLLEALVALDLSPAAWRRAAAAVAPPAQELASTAGLDAAGAALLALVPLASVRRRLRDITADASAPNALRLAIALAGVHDASGIYSLLAALEQSPDHEVAQALAALPLEELSSRRVSPLLWRYLNPARDVDPTLRLWCAVALARCGEFKPLERLWDALVRPPQFWTDGTRPVVWRLWDALPRPLKLWTGRTRWALWRGPSELFAGDPEVSLAYLARVRPLPQRVVQFLLGLRDRDYDTDWQPRRKQVGDARNAILLVAGLTGACDRYGEPLVEAPSPAPAPIDPRAAQQAVQKLAQHPWNGLHPAIAEGDRPLLAQAPAGLAAEALEAGMVQLAAQAPQHRDLPAFLLGNALLALANALPAGLPLRLTGLLAQPTLAELPREPLAWTLARAGAEAVLQALLPLIASNSGESRRQWLEWLVDIVSQVGAPPPFGGAGGPLAAPAAPPVLIDDDPAEHPREAEPIRGMVSSGPFEAHAAGEPPATGRQVVYKQASPKHSAPPAPAAATEPSRTVYADIGVDDPHPLAGANVNFTIELDLERNTETSGSVSLPDRPSEEVLTLRVHLLFGTTSAWSTLSWSAARGTVEPARFTLTAPAVDGERALAVVRANFYFEQRWCGEGRRHLDVRAGIAVAPLAKIPVPEEMPPWARTLRIERGAQPPDLIIRIQKCAARGDYVWSCLSPHRDFKPPAAGEDRMTLGEDAETFVRKTFAPLANKPLTRLKLADVEGAGEKLYRCTPPHFRDCYWALFHDAARDGWAFESVQIVTDEPCVPWELMRLADPERAPGVAPELLAIRHAVGRWLADRSAEMRQRIAVQRIAVSASSYDGVAAVSAKLPWAASERELLATSYEAQEVPLTSDAQLDFLEHGGVQAVHVACHGKMSIADPDASVLVMEDTPNDLTPLTIARDEVCAGLGREHPLVFLNACEIGATAASMSLVAGFPAAYLYAGAAALVSPLWAVNDERARAIAEQFYREAFANGRPLGEVLRDVRRQWKEQKHLTYLAYVLYGDPLARVIYRPV